MKIFIGFLTIALFSVVVLANITSDEEYVLNHSSAASQKAQLGTLINKTRNLLVAKYSYAVQGGTTASDISLITDFSKPKSYAVLPNKAIITNVWIHTVTQPASSSTSTVSVNAVSAGDLKAAVNVTSWGPTIQGIPNGATTNFIKLSAQKTIKATVNTTPLTAGKFDVFIEYVLGD